MYDLLKGMRVVEAASFIAAPSCALHLLQMGAEVIRIDAIGGGPDYGRWPLADNGASLYWEGLNKGKKSIAIDISRPEGRELMTTLITASGDDAGLFVTNYPVKGFLAHDHLAALRPDLISVRVMGWSDGRNAVDYTVNASVGVPYMTGPANMNTPVNHVLPAWDLLAGSQAAFSLLAAERNRRRTGVGQEIRVPLSDVAIASLGNLGHIAEVELSGKDRERTGNDLFGAFGRDFTTSDGQQVIVIAITGKQWTSLLQSLDLVRAITELESSLSTSFADEGARFRHREQLNRLVGSQIERQPYSEVAALFDRFDVCWAHYRTLADALTENPLFSTANPMLTNVKHPSGSAYRTPGPAATMMGKVRGIPRSAPRLGQHTDEILAEVLGLSSAEIGRLYDCGLVASPR